MNLLIHFPVKGHHDKFFETLLSYYENLDSSENVQFNIVVEENDFDKDELEYLRNFVNLKVNIVNSKNKIEAINSCIPDDGWGVLMLASHDMIPIKQGFDTYIVRAMSNVFPDTDGVLWYLDERKPDVCTLAVLGKKYYDRFGYIYNNSYVSAFCDNEFGEVAEKLGKCFRIDYPITRHDHPIWTGEEFDKEKFFSELAIDKKTYIERKENNFGL
jgi:hypothetical protein